MHVNRCSKLESMVNYRMSVCFSQKLTLLTLIPRNDCSMMHCDKLIANFHCDATTDQQFLCLFIHSFRTRVAPSCFLCFFTQLTAQNIPHAFWRFDNNWHLQSFTFREYSKLLLVGHSTNASILIMILKHLREQDIFLLLPTRLRSSLNTVTDTQNV